MQEILFVRFTVCKSVNEAYRSETAIKQSKESFFDIVGDFASDVVDIAKDFISDAVDNVVDFFTGGCDCLGDYPGAAGCVQATSDV